MNPDSPLQILKAVPRYAQVPFLRWSGRGLPRAFFFGPREQWSKMLEKHPEHRFIFRTTRVSAFEFQMSIAPWILADKRSEVFVAEGAPDFLIDFCARHRVRLTELKTKKQHGSGKDAGSATPRAPAWFQRRIGQELTAALDQGAPTFLYMPWIPEHGDAIIDGLHGSGYALVPFDLIKNVEDNQIRRAALKYAREHPDLYRRLVMRRLAPIHNQISGFILTFDWAPVMRIIVEACRDLDIPTILIPHESVFANRDLYYTDITSKASLPLCDVILGWGETQRRIFIDRGYPEDRFITVGAPKFDTYKSYTPHFDRATFCRLFGLDPEKKTILFAAQPLDSQLDQKAARAAQRAAIRDIMAYCEERGLQLLVRTPPSKEDVLGSGLLSELFSSPSASIDDAEFYLAEPAETIAHVDLVTSINSTMLFEAVLCGKPAISTKYIDFDQIWARVGIPAAFDRAELWAALDDALTHGQTIASEHLDWAATEFGVGSFDGQASVRIRAFLEELANGSRRLDTRTISESMFAGQALDIISIPSSETTIATTQKYLLQLMKARIAVDSGAGVNDLASLASVNVFLKWGIKDSNNKRRQRELAARLGKPVLIVEDGFIRSLDIGLSGTPGLGIILDDRTAYYDATQASRLEQQLETGPDLTEAQERRSAQAIAQLVEARVSKYNHAPDGPITIGDPARRKVLLVDQRFGDQSVESGLADETSFDQMILDAIERHPQHDIIVKQHPDAIIGGKSSYFSMERLARFTDLHDHIHPIAFDINPYALFDLVDDVYVATSGMGFEALMAGKRVHCYGVPFYSGWGLTRDNTTVYRRTRKRNIEDLFHYAYIVNSRYYNPDLGSVVEIENLIDYISKNKTYRGM